MYLYIHHHSTVHIYLNIVTNREKTAGIIAGVRKDFVTGCVTFGYKRLQNRKTLYSTSVTARYKTKKALFNLIFHKACRATDDEEVDLF